MHQFLGFGSGKDSVAPAGGTYNGEGQPCSGSAGSRTLTCGGSFSVGDIILIHQTRGAGADNFELNQVIADNGASLSLLLPLDHDYVSSGDDAAQVVEMKEYNGGTISGTLVPNAWDGNKGGIIPILCSGKLLVSGLINLAEKGFRGGAAVSGSAQIGKQGEGTDGPGQVQSTDANGNGAGGGDKDTGPGTGASGGGGGNATAGDKGGDGWAGIPGGDGGEESGNTQLTLAGLGGGGASGGTDVGSSDSSGAGARGGGFLLIIARSIEITGSIITSGGDGLAPGSVFNGGGGGGAAGDCLIKAINAVLGTNKIVSLGGNGGVGGQNPGGDGANGRHRVEACTINGVTNPAASESEGGHDWCSKLGHVF